MKRNFTYKKKLKILVWSTLPLFFLCYQLSFKKTIEQYIIYNDSISSEFEQPIPTTSFIELNRREKNVREIYEKYYMDSLHQTDTLLNHIDLYCKLNDITLKEYKPFPVYEHDSCKIYTRLFTLQADFISCVKFLYNLETNYVNGRIGSVQFKTTTEANHEDTVLNCSVYIQNIITN